MMTLDELKEQYRPILTDISNMMGMDFNDLWERVLTLGWYYMLNPPSNNWLKRHGQPMRRKKNRGRKKIKFIRTRYNPYNEITQERSIDIYGK